MKGSDKAVVLGVVMAVVLAAFYFMVLSPKRDKASELGKEIADLNAQVSQQEQIAQFGEQARKEFPTFYGRLVVLGKAVPAGSDTASLMVELSSIARETGTDFRGITLASGGGSTGSTASSSATTDPSSTSTGTTSTTPSESGDSASSSSASTSGTTTPTTVPAPATETQAANLPIGATVGPGELATMPYSLDFTGNYFQVADFLEGLDALIHTRGTTSVAADGRLLTIDAFTLSDAHASHENPTLKVAIAVTSYVAPATQGLTAGATPSGPALSLTPQAQPASATVAP